jgi:hypothetical protein
LVSPVTGPFVLEDKRYNQTSPTALDYYRRRERYRQVKPRDLVLPYQYYLGQVMSRNGDYASVSNWHVDSAPDSQTLSIAYERFKGELSERASGGVFVAEANQAVQMITDRATGMLRFIRALRKGDIGGAARALKVRPPKGASTSKNWASNYLEFHFGWAPMVMDIGNAVDVLQSPFKTLTPSSSARVARPEADSAPTYPYTRGVRVTVVSKVRLGANVRVNNPNLWLANQMGFINPLTIAWELVPFSFVVDWFANMEQFLGAGTDLCGLDLLNAYTTSSQEAVISYYWANYPWTSDMRQLRLGRANGIAKPTLGLRPCKIWGWRRCAAAVSLLVQFMR